LSRTYEKRGFFQSRGWRSFVRNRFALFGLAMIALLTTLSVAAPWIERYPIAQGDAYNVNKPPSAEHWLGTDEVGRDIWSRLLHGGRVSLLVGVLAVLLQTFIGALLGAVSGYFGGVVDMIVQRLVEVMMMIPRLMFLLILVSLLGPGLRNLFLAIALLNWPGMCRLVRGQILSIREMDFIMAARSVGATHWRIILRHMMPNLLGIMSVSMITRMGGAIMMEAGMSFLGLGVQPPTPSWGNMMNRANSLMILQRRPWIWMPPGLMMLLFVLSLNFVGDAVRDATDPHRRR
jgi:peptide/nickel transport system permease protein